MRRLCSGAYSVFSLFVIYDAFSGTAALFLIPGTLLICAAYFFCAPLWKSIDLSALSCSDLCFYCGKALYVLFPLRHERLSGSLSGMDADKGKQCGRSCIFLISLFLFFTFFFSVTVYYFSKVLYRMFFLTLISLIPCVLYVKVMSEINNVSLVLIALCNVAVFILHRNSLRDMGKSPKGHADCFRCRVHAYDFPCGVRYSQTAGSALLR